MNIINNIFLGLKILIRKPVIYYTIWAVICGFYAKIGIGSLMRLSFDGLKTGLKDIGLKGVVSLMFLILLSTGGIAGTIKLLSKPITFTMQVESPMINVIQYINEVQVNNITDTYNLSTIYAGSSYMFGGFIKNRANNDISADINVTFKASNTSFVFTGDEVFLGFIDENNNTYSGDSTIYGNNLNWLINYTNPHPAEQDFKYNLTLLFNTTLSPESYSLTIDLV